VPRRCSRPCGKHGFQRLRWRRLLDEREPVGPHLTASLQKSGHGTASEGATHTHALGAYRGEIRSRDARIGIDASSIRTTVPIALIHRRKGYLNTATRTLIALLDAQPKRQRR
jgi:hypothetical protein